MRAVLALAAAFASTLVAAGPAAAAGDERTAWAKAYERWAARDAQDYTYRVRVACFCPQRSFVKIRVRAGKPRGTPKGLRAFDTVEELFERIDEQLRRGGGAQARYARHTGAPRSFSADPLPEAVDDEYGVTVRDLKITRRG